MDFSFAVTLLVVTDSQMTPQNGKEGFSYQVSDTVKHDMSIDLLPLF